VSRRQPVSKAWWHQVAGPAVIALDEVVSHNFIISERANTRVLRLYNFNRGLCDRLITGISVGGRAEVVSDQAGCVAGATDKVVSFPQYITTMGFRLYANGSPQDTCGIYEGWGTYARAGWIAIGKAAP
jgi:hypothetical protein